MKEREPHLEVLVTAALAFLLGFFLAAGNALDGGGYLGYGVEHDASNVYINWLEPEFYIAHLIFTLSAFLVLMLLWRALDWLAVQRALKLQRCFETTTLLGNRDGLQEASQNDDTAATLDSPLDPSTVSSKDPKPIRQGQQSIKKLIKKRWFWLGALGLICCWIPFWLALWPGIYNYDAHYQYEMLVYAEMQTHHPVLHTLLLDGFVLFGEHYLDSANLGVELYLGLTLIIAALTFSWMLYTMAEEGAGKALLAGSFLFLSINPALVLWLISTNKDVLFTCFILLGALLLYRTCRLRPWELWLKEHSPTAHTEGSTTAPCILRIGVPVALALFGLVIALLAFRTSAIYSFIAFLPFAAFLIRKKLRIRLMGVMATATVVFTLLYLLFTQLIFQIPSGPWQSLDALSIPRQQLARVWVQTDDAKQTAAFQKVFSHKDLKELSQYEADDADPSRGAFRAAFEEKPLELLDLYLSMGAEHPGTYTDAALLTSYEAWLPGAVTDGYVMEEYFAKPNVARSSYIDVSAFWPTHEEWIFEDFGQWLKEFGLGNIGLDIAPVRLLCSPAVYMWLLLIVLARTICVRDRRGALVCTLLLTFGLTALLSPLVVMRYYLMVMAATPLLLNIATSPSWRCCKTSAGAQLNQATPNA